MASQGSGSPKYEAPVVVPLGEVAAGVGGIWCKDGYTANSCQYGYGADTKCLSGDYALTKECIAGALATGGECTTGGTPK